MLKKLLKTILVGAAALIFPISAIAKVIIPGTGDSQALLRQLASDFQTTTGIEVAIPESIGSFGAIKSVAEGGARLGRVARSFLAAEEQFGLNYRIFAYSPVVVVVNQPDNCVEDLSRQQLFEIFQGKLKNWKKLPGCPPANIFVANREPGDSCRTVLENHLPSLREVMGSTGKTVYTTPELMEILGNYQHTIGYAPLAMVEGRKLKVLSLDQIAPTAENVRNGSYPLAIPFGIIWKVQLNAEEKRFFDFLFSDQAQKRIVEMGLIPARQL
jgi:phosphate transport system substrate-binding protein